jgi:hypothetical protein
VPRYYLNENGADRFLDENGVDLFILEQQTGGIDQPTPNGGDITIEDDAHADTGYDAVVGGFQSGFSPEDMYLKALAFGWKAADAVTAAVEKMLGAVPKYLFHVDVQNGDGIGSAVTTFRATRCQFEFADGKKYKVSGTGRANRHFHAGSLQENAPADPTGYDGVDAVFGASTVIEGNHRVYGSRLVAAMGSMDLRREGSAQVGDVVASMIETLEQSASGQIKFGTNSQDTARVFDTKLNILGHRGGGISLFNVADARKLKTGGIANVPFGSATPYLRLRDVVISGTPATADILAPSQGCDLIDITWSRQAPQTIGTIAQQSHWATWLPTIVDIAGTPESGRLVELKDVFGAVVVSAGTDARGQITYSTGSPTTIGDPIPDAVIVKKTSTVEQGPFTVYVNGVKRRTFDWPRIKYTVGGTEYDQLLQVRDVIGPEEAIRAGFSADPGGGILGVSVQFTDLSTPSFGNTITDWLWDFGDLGTSTAQNPAHVYAAAGVYDVTLTVTDSSGGQAFETSLRAVYVAAPALGIPVLTSDIPVEAPLVERAVAKIPVVT